MATKKVTSLKLKDLYQESPEEKDLAAMQLSLDQGKLQLDTDLLATQQELSKAKARYEKALRNKPFDPQSIIGYKNEVRSLEAGIEDLNSLKELF